MRFWLEMKLRILFAPPNGFCWAQQNEFIKSYFVYNANK